MPYKDIEKQNEYCKLRLRRIRSEWFEKNGPCVKCGSWKQLELDHIDPSKKKAHTIWSWSPAKREEEAKKCQVLCNNCHKKKTAIENSRPITHGAPGGYARGCRCEMCRKYHSEKMRLYHLKTRGPVAKRKGSRLQP